MQNTMTVVDLQSVHHTEQLIEIISILKHVLEQATIHHTQQYLSVVVSFPWVFLRLDCRQATLLAIIYDFLHLFYQDRDVVLDQYNQMLETRNEKFMALLV